MVRIHDFDKLCNAFMVILCAVFFFLCMGLTLAGSSVYTNTVSISDANYTQRTALSYLVNQIRRGDRAGSISIISFEGNDAICVKENFDEYTFVTLLYCYDGQLRELFMEEGTGLGPADGTPILPVEHLTVNAEEGLITLTITSPDDGQLYTVSAAPRCETTEGGSL